VEAAMAAMAMAGILAICCNERVEVIPRKKRVPPTHTHKHRKQSPVFIHFSHPIYRCRPILFLREQPHSPPVNRDANLGEPPLKAHPHLLVWVTNEWRVPATGCNQWLSLAKIPLKVPPAGRNRSLVACTSRCGECIR
jgi:hypothetical protein